MANKSVGDMLLSCVIISSIFVGFTGLILSGFSDVSVGLPLGILFTVVVGIIFAVAVFNRLRRESAM